MREAVIDETTIAGVAASLRAAQDNAQPCAPVRDKLGSTDVEAAYAVQNLNTQYKLSRGRRLVGRKIGLTSHAVQRQLGVDQPDYGALFADMCVDNGAEVSIRRVLQPKVEAEVVCVLGRDLASEQCTMADAIGAVEFIVPGIEIVGSRIANWDISVVDTIADNASSGLFVFGAQPRKLADVDLRMCGMVLERNGDQVSTGLGAACLGHPMNALLWLARRLAALGTPLRAGDIVLTGALGPMSTVSAGDWIETRISGLGSVQVRFAA